MIGGKFAGSKRSQKRTDPKSDDNFADIASQGFASQISDLTKSLKDSHLALINRIEALGKQYKIQICCQEQ